MLFSKKNGILVTFIATAIILSFIGSASAQNPSQIAFSDIFSQRLVRIIPDNSVRDLAFNWHLKSLIIPTAITLAGVASFPHLSLNPDPRYSIIALSAASDPPKFFLSANPRSFGMGDIVEFLGLGEISYQQMPFPKDSSAATKWVIKHVDAMLEEILSEFPDSKKAPKVAFLAALDAVFGIQNAIFQRTTGHTFLPGIYPINLAQCAEILGYLEMSRLINEILLPKQNGFSEQNPVIEELIKDIRSDIALAGDANASESEIPPEAIFTSKLLKNHMLRSAQAATFYFTEDGVSKTLTLENYRKAVQEIADLLFSNFKVFGLLPEHDDMEPTLGMRLHAISKRGSVVPYGSLD